MSAVSVLLILMIALAVFALEAVDLIAAIIALGALGLCLSMSFLLMGAPDLAMILLIVEVVTLVSVVRFSQATDRSRGAGISGWVAAAGGLLCALLVIWLGYQAVWGALAAQTGIPWPAGVNAAAGLSTGARNPVFGMAFLLRGPEALAAISCLSAACIGAWIILDRGRREP